MSESTPFPSPEQTPPPPPKRKGRAITAVLLAATLAVFAVFAVAFGVVVYYVQRDTPAQVTEGSWLVIRLRGEITDAPVQGGLFVEPEDSPATATEIAAVIRKAAGDDRISGVVLRSDSPQVGWGLAREIRTALVDLHESDKPCVAYGEVYTTRDYYLASACDKVVIAPGGVPLVIGSSLSVTYYRDALAYLGVQPRFVWVGDYKTAVEPFERMEPSEAAQASYELLLDGIWDTVVQEIADSRGLSPDQVQAIIDNPSMTPSRMVESGLIDAVAYPDAVEAHLDRWNEDDWVDLMHGEPVIVSDEDRKEMFTSLKEYRKDLDDGSDSDDRIAVIYAEGSILSGKSTGGLFGSDGLFDGDFREWMRQAREDDSIKAVVVRVNSPGGSALASDMMQREVVLTRSIGKPVVVSMADYAASGGYMMSAPADWIVAQPTTVTGSIGVFGTFFDVSGTYEKLMLAEHTYKRGERADLLSVTAEQDERDREILQEFVQDTYDDFLGLVADGRQMEVDAVSEVAQGRVWTGSQAMDGRGLVDELGGLDEALAKARELATAPDAGVVRLPEKKGFIEVMMEELQNTRGPKVAVELDLPVPGVDEAVKELRLLQAIHESGGAAAYLPGVR